MENYSSNQPLEEGIWESTAKIKGYANFWVRFAALLIDGIILYVANLLIGSVFFGSILFNSEAMVESAITDDGQVSSSFWMMYFGYMSSAIIMQWLYYALMESSNNQATLGKMAVQIKVTDTNGDPISFGRATGRYFGKIISGLILLVGYIMAAFTERRQALHDIMAGTLVVQR